MKTNILILGGNGKTGRRVAERLPVSDFNIRIGSRSETPAFDWEDSSTWEKVLHGMDKVYITYQPDLAVPGALEAIREFSILAKKSGVKHLVLLSGKGEVEAERSEQVIINSGLDWTIVRASWFNQNFTEGFFLDPILAGMVALPVLDIKVPFVDADDIADVVVEALSDDKHMGRLYELTGTELITFREAVRRIAEVSKREIGVQSISMEEYTSMLKQFQVPETYIWLITYLFTEVLGNEKNQSISMDIEDVLGRKAKTFQQFVNEAAWNSYAVTS